jgi:hypothetical protein
MKFNRGALKFCGAYIGYFVLMRGLGYTWDFKGQTVATQLALFPALAPLSYLGLTEFIPVDSWVNSVFFFFPLCLVIVYFIGWAISGITNKETEASVGEEPSDSDKR